MAFRIAELRKMIDSLENSCQRSRYGTMQEYANTNVALILNARHTQLEGYMQLVPKQKRFAEDMMRAHRALDMALCACVQWAIALKSWDEAPEALRNQNHGSMVFYTTIDLARTSKATLEGIRHFGLSLMLKAASISLDAEFEEAVASNAPANCVQFHRKVA
jgi:hypothetical protein